MNHNIRLKNEHQYDDIIHLPHHVSAKHPQMSPENRAAQFSPFAALTGHGDAIRETARQTEEFVELNEDQKEQLNEQLLYIRENLSLEPEVNITYFQPDRRKNGGTYRTLRTGIKKMDEFRRLLLCTDGTVIPMESLFSVQLLSQIHRSD